MAKMQNALDVMRPMPPASLIESLGAKLLPAPELGGWVQQIILADDGALHNPDHAHLIDADIEFMWASSAFSKRGRTVVGQAEQVMFRAGGWQKARQEQQMSAKRAPATAAVWRRCGSARPGSCILSATSSPAPTSRTGRTPTAVLVQTPAWMSFRPCWLTCAKQPTGIV